MKIDETYFLNPFVKVKVIEPGMGAGGCIGIIGTITTEDKFKENHKLKKCCGALQSAADIYILCTDVGENTYPFMRVGHIASLGKGYQIERI